MDGARALFDLQVFGNIYARLSNPTTAVLEERIASLEGGRGATCTASGHSAQLLALFPLMEPGDHLVASTKLYGGSLTQFGKTFKKFGWSCEFVDVSDRAAVRAAHLAHLGAPRGGAQGGVPSRRPRAQRQQAGAAAAHRRRAHHHLFCDGSAR